MTYKTFLGTYKPPRNWNVVPGAVLRETCNPHPTQDCGCGINVASREWIVAKYGEAVTIWRVLIRWPWLAGCVVPYNTQGKFRASRIELLEVVS